MTTKRVYLLTGPPGVGKTTIVRQVAAQLPATAGGFYTEELRIGGVRQGFRIVTLDGQAGILARVGSASPYRVGKYSVDLAALDRIGTAAVLRAIGECTYIVVDEIGKMELFSSGFREAVWKAINSGKGVLGTVMLRPHPFADVVKSHANVRVVPVSWQNRAELPSQLLAWLGAETGNSVA